MKVPKATLVGAAVFTLTMGGAYVGRQIAINEHNRQTTYQPAAVTELASPSPFPTGVLATVLPRPAPSKKKVTVTNQVESTDGVDESPEPPGPTYVAPPPSQPPHSPRPSRTNYPTP